MLLSCLLLILGFYLADGHNDHIEHKNQTAQFKHESRRILNGKKIYDTRPYMVYLRPAKPQLDPDWLCGGVIIHARYILTSAACIEDVTHFYIVSGTHTWVPQSDTANECVKNGAIKAIWKCVPKTYRFDGSYYNNVNWMVNDIAVVMTAEPFNFKKRVRGCDFIPQPINFNNATPELESAGTKASVAGWGSTEQFYDAANAVALIPDENETRPVARIAINSPQLMEADVEVISKGACKQLWLGRYHQIIEDNMICGKNILYDEMHQACEKDQMECRELAFSAEAGGTLRRHHKRNLEKILLRSLAKAKKMRQNKKKSLRREAKDLGGFCENDHGGPLIAGQGRTAVLIGIMSAFRTMNHSTRCVGPFLYTSVYNSRNLINCAIHREQGVTCRTVLRSSSTVLDQEKLVWSEKKIGSVPILRMGSVPKQDQTTQDINLFKHRSVPILQMGSVPKQDKTIQDINLFKHRILRSHKRKNDRKTTSPHKKPHRTFKHSRSHMKMIRMSANKSSESAKITPNATDVSGEDEGMSISSKRRHGPPRRVRVHRRSKVPSTRKSLKPKN